MLLIEELRNGITTIIVDATKKAIIARKNVAHNVKVERGERISSPFQVLEDNIREKL